MLQQRVLDLPGADLVAAALDQVRRLAAHDADVAVRLPYRHVPGAEPAVGGERAGGRVRAVQIAGEQVRPAHLDLADRLPVVRGDRRPVLLHQSQLHPRQGQPDGARPGLAVGADGGVHQRLRHAVPLDDPAPGRRRDPLVVVDGQRGRPGDQQPGPGEGPDQLRVAGQCLGDPVVHRGHPEQHRRPVVQLPGHALGGEPAQVAYDTAAPQRAEDAEDQPVHMEQRQPVHEDVVAGPLPDVGQRVQRGGDGPPGDDGALGRTGGPGGVDDEGGVLVPGLPVHCRSPAAGGVDLDVQTPQPAHRLR